jgi:hypothetical protein
MMKDILQLGIPEKKNGPRSKILTINSFLLLQPQFTMNIRFLLKQ